MNNARRRARKFMSRPATEIAVGVLIVASVVLAIVEFQTVIRLAPQSQRANEARDALQRLRG